VTLTRRQFLHTTAAAATLSRVPRLIAAKYDLLVKGGRVIDPSQRIDRVADVAIQGGRITEVGSNLAATDAAEVIDASGKIVAPGLIDIHIHATAGIPAFCLSNGVTSAVDAGSKGADNIDEVLAVAKSAPNRVRVLINLSRRGNNSPEELLNLANADVAAARRAIEQHRDLIVGMKARLSRNIAGPNDLECVKRAKEATAPFKLPIMLHVGDTVSPLASIVALLRPGDIVTHLYAPVNGILDANGRVMPQFREARRRGVRFDFGNGRLEHFNWDVVEKALQQDFLPDTISSDMTDAGRTDGVFDFPSVLSKFLMLGLTLEQVIARATVNSAGSIAAFKDLGTLKRGTVADVAVYDLKEGDFEFVDNYKGTRTGHRKLVAQAVVTNGKRA
jgi:dihydroorotase